MEDNLTVRDYSKIFTTENGCIFVIYSLLNNGLYVASVKFNMTAQSCKILNLFDKDISTKAIENCVYQHRIKELESLKKVSHEEAFEILDNLLNDLQQKIHR